MPTLTGAQLAHALQEPQRAFLTQVLRTLGPERCDALLTATLLCEAQGGMRTTAGTRRTPGGVCLSLVRHHVTPAEHTQLFARTRQRPGPPLTTAALQALVRTVLLGDATVTVTLTGRPALHTIRLQETYALFRLCGKTPASLPTGLPPVPGQTPIPWLVVIALQQWTKVQARLTAQADAQLLIVGHPVLASDGTCVLLAQQCTPLVPQRALQAAQGGA